MAEYTTLSLYLPLEEQANAIATEPPAVVDEQRLMHTSLSKRLVLAPLRLKCLRKERVVCRLGKDGRVPLNKRVRFFKVAWLDLCKRARGRGERTELDIFIVCIGWCRLT